MTARGASRDVRVLAGVTALFFCSGVSGLVFEVIWVRALALWVGHSTLAVSLVVAAFLAGLVLGSYFAGPWADRITRPLRAYAVLELSIGVTALGVTLLLARLGATSGGGAMLDALAVRVAIAFVLLVPPTFAMGATLPVLTRFVTRDVARVGESFGSLYAVNTLGAAFGCGLAGFVWIGRLGLFHTALVAVAFNVGVGLVALGWDLRAKATSHAGPSIDASEPRDDAGADVETHTEQSLFVIAFATGFSSIACEVLWFRVLRSFVESSTYAFTLLLVTFLVGLVAGGALFARYFAGKDRPWQLLANVQLLLAFAGLASIALLGAGGNLFALLTPFIGKPRSSPVAQAILAAVVVLGPATFIGMTYPLVMQLGAKTLSRLGRSIGALSAANTIGGAFASLVTGLWIIPLLGTQRALVLALTANLAIAIALSFTRDEAGDGGLLRRIGAPLVFLGVAWFALPSHYLVEAVSNNPAATVLAVREGRDGTAVVYGYDRASVCRASKNHCRDHCKTDFSFQQITFGTISYASTIPAARRYMRALAHLPLLLDEGASRVLEICFGTGTTAGAFTTWPSLASLTIVDINADVLALAPHFVESNEHVLDDPRVHAFVEDGRHYLATHRETFDVISLEPPPPKAEGAATLYTSEFYVLARRRLAPGGILAQWIPFEQQTEGMNRSLLRAIEDAFPEVHVYMPSRVEGVILASDRPMRADLDAWSARFANERVKKNLAQVGFVRPESLLATFVLDTDGVRRYVAGAMPITDDLPAVEYFRSHPGKAYALEAMLAEAALPASMAARVDEPQRTRLARETDAVRGQMAAEMALAGGDLPRARALARESETTIGEPNSYAEYLMDVELDCTSLPDP